ncbi:hypothetical protein QSI_1483 [Clostridioides difficile P28]|nr:hypothetical protein QSI_1483 [Clostridioides difficile P28]
MHDKKKIFQAIYKLLSYNYIVLRKAVVEMIRFSKVDSTNN